jgi:hypothetical protein
MIYSKSKCRFADSYLIVAHGMQNVRRFLPLWFRFVPLATTLGFLAAGEV